MTSSSARSSNSSQSRRRGSDVVCCFFMLQLALQLLSIFAVGGCCLCSCGIQRVTITSRSAIKVRNYQRGLYLACSYFLFALTFIACLRFSSFSYPHRFNFSLVLVSCFCVLPSICCLPELTLALPSMCPACLFSCLFVTFAEVLPQYSTTASCRSGTSGTTSSLS